MTGRDIRDWSRPDDLCDGTSLVRHLDPPHDCRPFDDQALRGGSPVSRIVVKPSRKGPLTMTFTWEGL